MRNDSISAIVAIATEGTRLSALPSPASALLTESGGSVSYTGPHTDDLRHAAPLAWRVCVDVVAIDGASPDERILHAG